jgi:hypothetical protein
MTAVLLINCFSHAARVMNMPWRSYSAGLSGTASGGEALERDVHTLQTTTLINELYLRLSALKLIDWQNRAHFWPVRPIAIRFYPGVSVASGLPVSVIIPPQLHRRFHETSLELS